MKTYHLRPQIFSTFSFVPLGYFSNLCLISSLFKTRKHYQWDSESTSPSECLETSNRSTLFGLQILFLLFHMLGYMELVIRQSVCHPTTSLEALWWEKKYNTAHWLEMEMDVWMKCFVGKGLAFQLVCKMLSQCHVPIIHNAWFIFSMHLHTKLMLSFWWILLSKKVYWLLQRHNLHLNSIRCALPWWLAMHFKDSFFYPV